MMICQGSSQILALFWDIVISKLISGKLNKSCAFMLNLIKYYVVTYY